MKTLIITLEYPPQVGGIASYVNNVAAHLPAASTVVYAPVVKGDSEFDKSNSWKVYRRNPYWPFVWPRWTRMLWQIYSVAKIEKIEMIHVHHALPSGYVAWILNKWLRLPYIVFLHGSDLQLAEQHPSKLSKFAMVCRAATKVVVNSKFFHSHLQSLIPGLKNISVIYPSPPDSFYASVVDQQWIQTKRAQLGLSGKKVIITASRMVERKGFVQMAQMLPTIMARVPNVVWLAVGDGPEKSKLLQIIEAEKLQSVVRVFPAQSQTDLFNLMHLADVFVLLTHRDVDGVEEAWGGVLVEAAAAGLPVVVGRSGGVAEAVVHGDTGVVVDANNPEMTVASIVDLLEHPEAAHRLGEAGRKRAIGQFAWGPQMDKII